MLENPIFLNRFSHLCGNPAYLILVHELLEAIDKLSQVQNTTMEDVTETIDIRSVISLYNSS